MEMGVRGWEEVVSAHMRAALATSGGMIGDRVHAFNPHPRTTLDPPLYPCSPERDTSPRNNPVPRMRQHGTDVVCDGRDGYRRSRVG